MGTAATFVGIFLLSLVVALMVALQFADFFRAEEEFIAVILTLFVFSTAAMIAFAIAYGAATRIRILHGMAIALAVLALALAGLPPLTEWIENRSSNPFNISELNVQVGLELVIPALVAVLVQWGLVRRRWLRVRGLNDLSRWPWVTTVIAGLVVLNPIGLEIVSGAVRRSPTNWLWELWLMIALGGALIVVVMAAIECSFRARMLRRRG
jgi:hypothetical protein